MVISSHEHEHTYIPPNAKVLSATVSEQAGRWYVSVQVEEEQEPSVPTATTAEGYSSQTHDLPLQKPRPGSD
jgi:hypothetical protein